MDLTNPTTLILVAVILLIVGILLAMAFTRFQRSKRLRDRFGPEYERTLDRVGDKRQAEQELEERLTHVESLNIRSLSAEEVNRFALEWQSTQAEFVDQPLAAVKKANRMIRDVMSTRGYPVDDFEQRAADISVDYPELVENYRGLHALAARDGSAPLDTEEMRQAMIHARSLFEELVRENTVEPERKETVGWTSETEENRFRTSRRKSSMARPWRSRASSLWTSGL